MNFNGITISSGGIYISSGGNSGEKTNFGNKTVSKINVSSSVRLHGTTVEGKVRVEVCRTDLEPVNMQCCQLKT